jgi:nicotinate-nucleotide adenylyltransferase
MRLGILGGTFNPVHFGHLLLAQEALEQLSLEKVIFVPSFLPPHKTGEDLASADRRLRMVSIAVKDNRSFDVSDMEIERKSKSYSIDTLREFLSVYAEAELFFISGSDALKDLSSWKDIEEIKKIANFAAAARPGYGSEDVPEFVRTISMPRIAISSSLIREKIRKKRSIKYLLPEDLRAYIEDEGLYSAQ